MCDYLTDFGARRKNNLIVRAMYIIAIAWIYVVVLMAATESNVTAAVATFLFYGLLPLALLLWLFGGPSRRRRRLMLEAADRQSGGPDGGNAEPDQQHLLQGGNELGPAVQPGDEIGHGDVDHAGTPESQKDGDRSIDQR